MAMLLPLTSWAAGDDDKKVTVKAADVFYAGDATTSGITVTCGEAELQYGKDYVATYKRNGEGVGAVRDAGEYEATITLLDEYFNYEQVLPEGGAKFTVKKLPVTGGVQLNSGVTVPYTGEEIKGTEEIDEDGTTLLDALVGDLSAILKNNAKEGTDAERANFLAGLKLVGLESAPIGPNVNEEGYGVQVTDNGNDNWSSNYQYSPGVVITTTQLMITPIKLTVELAKSAYTGVEKNLKNLNKKSFKQWNNSTNKFAGVLDDDQTDFDIALTSEEGNPTDVGTYKLTATPNNSNYVIEDEVDYEIIPVALTITKKDDANLKKVYDGSKANVDVTESFTISGFKGGDETTLKPTLKLFAEIENYEKAGDAYNKYGIALYQEDATKKTYSPVDNLTNYTFENPKDNFEITKLSIGNGEAVKGFKAIINEEGIIYNGKDYAAKDNWGKVAEMVTSVKCTPETKGATELTLNYEDDYTIEAIGATGNEVSGTAVNAGEWFTIVVKGTGNYTGSVNYYGIKIEKAKLEISLKGGVVAATTFKKVADGKQTGNLAEYFKFNGLVDVDSEVDEEGKPTGTPKKEVLTMEARYSDARTEPYYIRIFGPNSGIAGGWAAPFDEKLLKNYIVTSYEQQTYTILDGDKPMLLDRAATEKGSTVAEVCEKYNGAANVPVKMPARKFTANQWYPMVLPFDIKVSEFSKALGYAVVDVPNEDNTDAGVVAFKLHVGTIPANTLFVFKVETDPTAAKEDGGMGLEVGEDNFDFGIQEIKYDPKFVVTDKVEGNPSQFIGTYAQSTKISEDGYWYMTGGKFYNAFADYKATGNAVDVPALNGYVICPPVRANARILIEEADGTTTAINAITGEVINNTAEGWYTVGGMKLNAQPTQKGVYINNGKKVVIK